MSNTVSDHEDRCYTPHEKWVMRQGEVAILGAEASASRARVNRILKRVHESEPRMSVERARYFMESMRRTEGLPVTLRWAMAMANIMAKIDVHILPDELIVGRGGEAGRYGILYPELDGGFLGKPEFFQQDETSLSQYTPEALEIIREEISPYCANTAFRDILAQILPDDVKNMIYKDGDPYKATMLIMESATHRSSLQWVLDYKKVIEHGLESVCEEAKEIIATLDSGNIDKLPFYKSVVIVCEAARDYAKRHANLARDLAATETDGQRKKELLEIAEICDHVPWKPARTFREAMQAQWFTQLISRYEQMYGGAVGNGRIDQYLYPLYKKDIAEGRLTKGEAMELFECLWLNMAQSVYLHATPTVRARYEGNAHFEHTTIGGVTADGADASNELTYLLLQSKKEFPLDFPDLSVRIHAGTPDKLLMAICDVIKEGTGFPKLLNDEEIVLQLVSKGATLAEARDYCGSGCTEVRIINRNTYFTGTTYLNLPATVEMVLYNGRCTATGDRLVGLETGAPENFATFEDLFAAFQAQVRHLIEQSLKQLRLTESIRPSLLGAPFGSALHGLCMKEGKDVNMGRLEGALCFGPQLGPIGFGTAIDSLAAIRHLVYDKKLCTITELAAALRANFEGYEVLRQHCLNAPKYGNMDDTVDTLGRLIDDTIIGTVAKYENYYGGHGEVFYVPVTSHIAMGRAVGATPNGRRNGEFLSEGISPSQGADTLGLTATLQSIRNTKKTPFKNRTSRLLNIKLLPQCVDGEEGSRSLSSLIRTWCDQKHWHIQFNIVNSSTLVEAQKEPEKYRNLIVRVAGYSAYFVNLSKSLQDELICRTGHDSIG